MKKNSGLFDLIQSMTQNEKRYFKLFSSLNYSGKNKNYVQLFDAIDGLKKYDEEKLKKKIKNESILKFFAQSRRHLYVNILKSLRSYHAESSIDNQISSNLHEFEILHTRSLFKQARKALKKAKDLSIQYERNTDLLKIYSLETRLLRSENNVEELKKHTLEVHSHLQQVLHRIENTIEFDKEYAKIVKINKEIELIRSEDELKELQLILMNPLFEDESKALTNRNKLKFHYIKGIYSYFIGDFQEAAEQFDHHIDLFVAHPEIIEEQQSMYVRALQNGLFMDIKSNRYLRFIEKLDLLKSFDCHALDLQHNVDYSVYLFSVMYYNEIGQFDKAVLFMEENESSFMKLEEWVIHNNVFYEETLYIRFASSFAYLGVKDFKKSLKHMNNYMNNADKDLKQDSYCIARILNLLIHYELGNEDLLDYIVKSTIRFLKKKDRLYLFENAIMRFISTATTTTNSAKFSKALKKLKVELLALKDHPYEKNVFAYFDFISWIDSKLEEVDLSNIVQRNHQEQQIPELN
jgi:sulfur transfer complex TusBCD TusB component (DsrH family)